MRAPAPAFLAALLAFVPAFSGCTAEDSPDVMASFYPLQFFTQRILGPDLDVGSVAKPGTEPHDYDPTPNDLARIVEAEALVIQGAGFESWLRTAQSQAPRTKLIVATEGLELMEGADDGHGHDEGDEGMADPHTWLDPALAQQMARTIQAGLAEVYPDRAADLQTNADRLVADLQRLDAEFREGLATCALDVIVANHSAFGYPAARYGFRQVSISGLDPNDEPDPQTVQAVIEEAREHGVGVIFFEDLVSPQVARTIADEVGAETRLLSPIEGIPNDEQRDGKDYFTQMRLNLANLRDGLKCE